MSLYHVTKTPLDFFVVSFYNENGKRKSSTSLKTKKESYLKNMSHLIITRGLPASGKSTFAAQWVKESPDTRVEVNRDFIRTTLGFPLLGNKDQEKAVTVCCDALMEEAASRGADIIVSNTNLRERYIKQFFNWANDHNYSVEIKDFVVDLDELIKRNNDRGNPVSNKVIEDLHHRFPYKNWATVEDIKKALGKGATYTPYKNDPHNPTAIIVDIDGTLAHHDNVRSPFEFDKVAYDEVDEPVKDAVLSAHQYGHTILVVSGRSDSCYKDTAQWLDKYGIPYHDLFMRSHGDKRKDWIVKDEIIRTHIQDNYHVIYCLDDRNQVVDHNRAMGYKVFQVQPGDF